MKPTYKSFNQQNYLYTKGKEYMVGLEEYIGEYHIQNNKPYTGPTAKPESLPLSPFISNKSIIIYDLISKSDIRDKSYETPYDSFDTPTKNQYTTGVITRYFIRRRNDPYMAIMEISSELGKSYGKENGINNILYEMIEIKWQITNNPDDVEKVILNNVIEMGIANKKFPGISQYFTSAFEYSYENI